MKTAISLIRIAILVTLGLVAFLLIFGEEQDETTLAFCLHVFFDKTVGVLCILGFSQLYQNWCKYDKWIARFDAWNAKGLEE
ncbi:hypothetical protein HDR69_00410 [bacterium]|nr:hypothetical protein [bacterium]